MTIFIKCGIFSAIIGVLFFVSSDSVPVVFWSVAAYMLIVAIFDGAELRGEREKGREEVFEVLSESLEYPRNERLIASIKKRLVEKKR